MSYRASDWPKRVIQAAGLSVSALAVVVLIGWQIHSRSLIQVLPTLAPMQRMTALGFLLSGIALVLLSVGRKRPAGVGSLAVLVLAGLVCLEYALDADFGIDELLGRDSIDSHTPNPGRMSPVTALCFIAGSVAVLVAASRRLTRSVSATVGILASMLVAVGTVSVLGYLLGHTETYRWSQFTRMALHSSTGFAVLGIGLIAWAWQESRTTKGAPDWLPLSVGLGLAVAVLGVWQVLRSHEASDLPLISAIILVGGLLGALLVAFAISQTQQAHKRSRELQEGKEVLERLFEASPDALLLTDHQGLIIRANQRVETTFGYTREELLGQPVEILVPEKVRHLHRTHRKEYYARPSTRSMGQQLELHGRRKDGSEFPVEIALSPIKSGGQVQVLAVVRDITERKHAQDALRESEERFRSVFEQGPIGITLMGIDARMLKVNSAFCRMLGYTEAELIRMTPLDITHPDDREASVDLMEILFHRDSPVGKLEKRYIKKNGEIMWASLTASVIRHQDGKPLYGVGMIEDITERKRAEADLRLGNEIFANMEEGVCLVRLEDGIIVHANPKFERMFGYNPEELTGKHVVGINATAHKHSEETAEEIRREVSRSGVWRGEVLHQRKNGTPFWCAVTVSMFHHPEFGKVGVSIHQDISERKQSQQKLAEQAALLNLAHDSISVRDLERRIIFWNRGAEETYGWSAEQAMGQQAPELLRGRYPIPLEEIENIVLTQGHWEGEVEQTTRYGRKIFVDSRWSLWRDERGAPRAFLVINRDISARKRMEAQLEASKEQLVASARLSALGMMAGNIAHEINNPVGIIHALASNLIDMVKEEGVAPPEMVERNSTRIRETADRIARIIKSMRQISREGAEDKLFPTRVGKIVEETLEICRERFRANAVKLLLPGHIPDLSVSCREVQIAQVLLNLLQNAFDAVVEQPGERWVRLDVEVRDDSAVISVTDSGPGIPLELRPRIMEPFFTTKPVGKGTGLGLSLSKTIAEEHGGKLEYAEDQGRTRFSLTLPLARQAEVVWT